MGVALRAGDLGADHEVAAVFVQLGQPQPESNLVPEENSGSPQQTQR